ncbi:hypothetical protein SDC9_207085 [bioreactor metagenome]|uniref:Uncharacterized protein n=1 Tax=bioreactor metagenome TaxID=1076179 RepID=A0A645JG88_9ZZZZ
MFEQTGQIKTGVSQAGQQAAHRQDADQLVQRFPAGGQATVMAGRQLILDVFPGLFEVENFDVAARGHDIFDGDGIQFEQTGQNGVMFLRDQMGGFEHQAAQLFGG